MSEPAKRKANSSAGGGGGGKKTKVQTSAGGSKKQWRAPKNSRDGGGPPHQPKVIQPGDSGIWVTCNKGKESRCIGEMRDLFNEYAEKLYPQGSAERESGEGGDEDGIENNGEEEIDIEKEIAAEVKDIRKPATARLFTPLMVNVQCVTFFKTISPVDPVSLVKTICSDAMNDKSNKRTRFAKRLSPMTLMGRASAEGLEKVATAVLAPHFHREPFQKRKFAIRPSLRNHNVLTRNGVIEQVASIVGRGHQVDLKDYDLLILVEVYQNVCGVSVVDNSFEELKRFNISEIFEPTPKEEGSKDSEQEQGVKEAS